MDKLIINTALTGNIPTKADNPHVPITPEEIAQDAGRCYQAGAVVFHLHARDKDGRPTYKKEVYGEIISRVRQRCPEAIICGSTSGRIFKTWEERSQVLDLDGDLKPEMASLTLGSMNFSHQSSMNEPAMIRALAAKMQERGIIPELEIFDMGMLDYARYLIGKGILKEPFYFNLILGSLGTLSANPFNLSTLVMTLPPGAIWNGAGVGRYQFLVNSLSIVMGGQVRVGLEDNLYYDAGKSRPASNVELVERLVRLARAAEREIATPAEARQVLGLPARG